MKELLELIKKSKTAKSGIITIVVGIFILFGTIGPDNQQATIDDMQSKTDTTIENILGIIAMGSGLLTIKGRNDVEKKLKAN